LSHRVRNVIGVPRLKRQVTRPAEPAEPAPVDDAPVRTGASWGRPTPADAETLRGLPAIGRGIGCGAIRGTHVRALRVPVEPVQVARRITLQPLPGCYPAHGCGQRRLVS
jgi:hypothetical protein